MSKSICRSLLSGLMIIALLSVMVSPCFAIANNSVSIDSSEAHSSLDQGRALLRRNHADQALPLLENALQQFTQAGDASGAALTHDALGDIYARQGEYDVALQHYQSAYTAFRAKNETSNASMSLAKIAETHYLSGDTAAALADFDNMQRELAGGLSASGNSRDNSRKNASGGGGGVTFASISASLPWAASACSSLNSNNSNNPSNPADLSNPANAATPTVQRSLGHAPKGVDGIGRMDLHVVDQDGNPVKGVKARLSTVRPNGLHCDCWSDTDANGEALMNPIHVGEHLKLELKASGFESQTIEVQPDQLAQPYRVVMQAKNAARAAKKTTSAAANSTAQNAVGANSLGACFDLYRLYTAYVIGEFGLGRIKYSNNQFDDAQVHYQNVLAASDSNTTTGKLMAARLYRAVARTSLGDIAFGEGRYPDAVKLYTQAANGAQQDNRLELAWGAQRGIGRALWAQAEQERNAQAANKLREDALQSYRQSLKTIETILEGSLRADDARTMFLATTKDVFDETSSALAEMALRAALPADALSAQSMAHSVNTANAPLSGQALAYAAEGLKIVEQGRARSLLDMLGEARANITEGIPANLLQRTSENFARQQEIAEQLTGVHPSSAVAKQNVAELETELDRLTVEANSLESQARSSSPRYAALVQTQPLTLAQIQQQVLDDQTVLLEYSLGKERSYLWAATKNSLNLYRLPSRAVIDQQVIALREQMVPSGARRSLVELNGETQRGISSEIDKAQNDERGVLLGGAAKALQNVSAYEGVASALYQTVLAPISSLANGKRLLIVADGTLNFIPFEALVSETGRADYASLAYLLKTNEVIYAPSVSVVAAIRQQSGAHVQTGRGMLLIADPVFDEKDSRAKSAKISRGEPAQYLSVRSAVADVTSMKPAGLKLARLLGTRTEAERIAETARTSGDTADVWLDLDASEANVRTRELSKYRVLHFATHGLLDTEHPQFTGLAFSLVGDADDDGFLRVGEVFNLRLGSPLVILSACETGLGKERRGEGVIGLTRAFMYAGAPTVGVSLWSVADRSTADLMPEFYKHLLKDHESASAALRAAQQNMIAGRKYSAPFYWAPFVLVGDWK